jgi:hypothetical protein
MPPVIFRDPRDAFMVPSTRDTHLEALMAGLGPFLTLLVGLVVGLAILVVFASPVAEARAETDSPLVDKGRATPDAPRPWGTRE